MEVMTTGVATATGLDPAVAKAAIGHVLLFLRDQAPESRMAEFIGKMQFAAEAVEAAAATRDGGLTAAIEGMTSFMGYGRADLNILYGKLTNLGLDEAQIRRLLNEVLARAESLIGKDGVSKIMQIIPALAERVGHAEESFRRSA